MTIGCQLRNLILGYLHPQFFDIALWLIPELSISLLAARWVILKRFRYSPYIYINLFPYFLKSLVKMQGKTYYIKLTPLGNKNFITSFISVFLGILIYHPKPLRKRTSHLLLKDVMKCFINDSLNNIFIYTVVDYK